MPRDHTRRRVLLFCLGVAMFTALVQWDGLPGLLDDAVGYEWSTPLVDFLRLNTQGMIIMVLLSLYLEFIGFDRSGAKERAAQAGLTDLLDITVASSAPQALARAGLAKEFGPAGGDALSQLVSSRGPVISEAHVRIEVVPEVNGDFRVRIRLSYRSDIHEFVVAQSTDPLMVEAMSSIPAVSEVYLVEPTELAMPPAPNSDRQVGVIVRSAGKELASTLTFKEITKSRLKALLDGSGVAADNSRVKVFVSDGKLPSSDPGADAPRFEFSTSYVVSADVPTTFWLADRPMHVREIAVDLRAIGQPAYARAQVHLAAHGTPWAHRKPATAGEWIFPLDTWLVAGQGLHVVWPTSRTNSVPVTATLPSVAGAAQLGAPTLPPSSATPPAGGPP